MCSIDVDRVEAEQVLPIDCFADEFADLVTGRIQPVGSISVELDRQTIASLPR